MEKIEWLREWERKRRKLGYKVNILAWVWRGARQLLKSSATSVGKAGKLLFKKKIKQDKEKTIDLTIKSYGLKK